MSEVIIPKLGESVEYILLKWKTKNGESVEPGDTIAEIETDKCNVEIEAQNAGVLHVKAEVGTVLSVGAVIAVIDEGDVIHKPYYVTPSMTKKRSWLSQIKRNNLCQK